MFVYLRDKKLIRVYISILLVIFAFISTYPEYVNETIFIIAWGIAGYEVLKNFFFSLMRRNFFDVNVLMSVATFCNMYFGKFAESALVMILFAIVMNFKAKSLKNINGVVNDYIHGRTLSKNAENANWINEISLLLNNARKSKSNSEKFVRKFIKFYTPIILLVAFFLVSIPLLKNIYVNEVINIYPLLEKYIERALILLVIAAPYIFVISVPTVFFVALGVISKYGVFLKGENRIDELANVNVATFDKNKTLIQGTYKVSKIVLEKGVNRVDLNEIVLTVVSGFNSPIADALNRAFGNKDVLKDKNDSVVELDNKGFWFKQGITDILIGNKELMNERNILLFDNKNKYVGNVLYVAKDGKHIATMVLVDEYRQDSKILISQLRRLGIKTVMFSGDVKEYAEMTAKAVGVDEWYYCVSQDDKLYNIEVFEQRNNNKGKVLYIGDGTDDLSLIKKADIGVLIDAKQSNNKIAKKDADIIIADKNISKIFLAINFSKNTLRIVKQNLLIALTVKCLILLLAIFGFMTMWIAILTDTGVIILILLSVWNMLRIFNGNLR